MPLNEHEILSAFDNYYYEAWYAWNNFYPEAERDLQFYLGDQWSMAEKRALQEEGRNSFVFNRIRRVINMVTGYQRKNRLSSVVVPIEGSDQKTADQLSQLLTYVMSSQDGYNTISDCFGGALKTGWNLGSVYVDYRNDPIDGDIIIDREPWNGFIIDPYFTKLDLSDCAYILRRKYLSENMVVSLLPTREREIRELHHVGWERDDKFTWLPYQTQPGGDDLMAYSEMYLQRWSSQKVIVDRETGRWADFEGSNEDFQRLKAMQPSFEMVKRQRRYIDMYVIVNNQVLHHETNPFGLDEYPFVPFVAIWEPESSDWSMKVQSLTRGMIDPQRESNRRRSQMIDLLDSQINSGWIATEGSVVNPRSLFQASQGKVIWKHQDAAPDAIIKIPPAQIPPSMFQLQQQFDQDINEIAGVNDAAFGQIETANDSGVLQLLRQGAAITNLQDLFDNLRRSQKALSGKVLKLIQKWSPAKVARIINAEPTKEFYEQSFTKYDCVIQEGVLTDTQRQQFFRQLIDLQQLGVPIPPMLLAKAAPLQGKSEYMEEMEQFQQQQAQQAAEQQKIQEQLLSAQTNLATSKSVEQMAGAKERFTRAVANLGLEDERNSMAVENRADAALKHAQTANELAALQMENTAKYLSLVELMDKSAKAKADRLKEEDVTITALASSPAAQAQQASPIQQDNQELPR
jgi:hypothetical protein